MKEIAEKKSGLRDLDEMIPCRLAPPEGEVESIIYFLFIFCGRVSTSKKGLGRSAYNIMVGSTGKLAFQYRSEYCPVDYVEWEVPHWALNVAMSLQCIVRDAQNIGEEFGYGRGLRDGKSFVKRLAEGTMDPSTFEDADGRNPTRLNRKTW